MGLAIFYRELMEDIGTNNRFLLEKMAYDKADDKVDKARLSLAKSKDKVIDKIDMVKSAENGRNQALAKQATVQPNKPIKPKKHCANNVAHCKVIKPKDHISGSISQPHPAKS